MAYNTSLANACKHLEFTPANGDAVSDTDATAMWTAVYLEIMGTLAAVGITVGAGNDLTYAQEVEAMGTSARVGAAVETQAGGKVSDKTRHLLEQYQAAMNLLGSARGARMMDSLGATVTDRIRNKSMATDYPNDDLDTSDYEAPLQNRWTIGGKL